VPVERPDIIETTAMGAGALAGLAVGVWKDADAFIHSRHYERFSPGAGRAAAQEGAKGWHRAVRAALHWARDKENA
jgi:glycerol kinase